MSEAKQRQSKDFSLVVPVSADPGEDVILPVHLSSETSAVSMNIRWFRGTELIYQYMNGLESTNNDYENRVSLSIQELERGNVSLTLRNVQESDSGKYTCKVYRGDVCQKTATVHLQVRGEGQLQREIVELKRQLKKVKLDGQIKTLELEKQRVELEKQRVELEKQRVELEMERQIMELERPIEALERQINELRLPTHTLHGSSPRRRNSIHGIPPRMSDDDGTPMTPETEEQRETRDTSGVERESCDPDTTQTGEETTVTDQETPGTSPQVQQRTERATQTQEDPGATVQMDQERRQESESTEQE